MQSASLPEVTGVHTTPKIITRLSQRFDECTRMTMKQLELDGTNWKTRDDFYDAFFKAVGAPSWHGRNFNALRDSIITGEINEVELVYDPNLWLETDDSRREE